LVDAHVDVHHVRKMEVKSLQDQAI
jgi:hypothetical protein